jgi:hypothetical protein
MWHWLSFADKRLPKGSQFMGVALIEASHFVAAVTKAHILGINPGGSVMGQEADPGHGPPPERFRDRLLSLAEIKVCAKEWLGEDDVKSLAEIEAEMTS